MAENLTVFHLLGSLKHSSLTLCKTLKSLFLSSLLGLFLKLKFSILVYMASLMYGFKQ